MTAPTPPPATGRDTGGMFGKMSDPYRNSRRPEFTPHDHAEYVEGCFRCDLSREEAQPPAPQTGASVEALADVVFFGDMGSDAHMKSCRIIARAILASDWLAQRDAAVRAEVGERIATAIGNTPLPNTETTHAEEFVMGVLWAQNIARTTGGDR